MGTRQGPVLEYLCSVHYSYWVMKDFLIPLWHAALYTTGWLIDHAWKSNKQITIVSWPKKLHHKMDFYIFYLINKLFITKTGIHIINSYMHEKCFVRTYCFKTRTYISIHIFKLCDFKTRTYMNTSLIKITKFRNMNTFRKQWFGL